MRTLWLLYARRCGKAHEGLEQWSTVIGERSADGIYQHAYNLDLVYKYNGTLLFLYQILVFYNMIARRVWGFVHTCKQN